MSLIDDFNAADDIINNERSTNIYRSIYPFSTENLAGYLSRIDLNFAKVLSIGSSGDHAINSMLYGAKQVDCFDINKLTEYYIKLKIESISAFSYNEFIDFFIRDDDKREKLFDKNKYIKVRGYLDVKTQSFWDKLYRENVGYELRESPLFKRSETTFELMKKQNPYLNEPNYKAAKKRVTTEKINFINSDILDIGSKLGNEKYDYMFLSNISSYLDSTYKVDTLKKFKKYLLDELSKYLRVNGSIFFGYVYKASDCTREYAEINSCDLRKKIFKGNRFESFEVDSAKFAEQKDLVLVYKKIK